MSRLYGPHHRALQDRFDMRRLADGIELRNVKSEISQQQKEFIESRDMFWLATVDHEGRPTVSYKGGDPGFVRVVDPRTIAFPCYDGNGMFYSMGNLMGNGNVGMLFASFARPHRLRVQGLASVRDDDPLLAECFEAQMIVRVSVTEIFRNCPALRASLRQGQDVGIRAAGGKANSPGRMETRRQRPSRIGCQGSGPRGAGRRHLHAGRI
jgi:uncharacterized protein